MLNYVLNMEYVLKGSDLPHAVYVWLVSFKGLNTLPRTHVPHIGLLIAALPMTTKQKVANFSKFNCFTWAVVKAVLTPETNVFPVSDGARSRHSTSAACPWKLCNSCPLSTSHNAHVPSPLDVRILNTCRKKQIKVDTGCQVAVNGLSLRCDTSCDQEVKFVNY